MVYKRIRTLLLTLVLAVGLVTLTAPWKGMEARQGETLARAAAAVREPAGAPRLRRKLSPDLVRDG